MDGIFFGPRFLYEFSFFALDLALGFFLAWQLWIGKDGGGLLLILLGAFGGILPDLMQIVYGLWKNKFTAIFQQFHDFAHGSDKYKIEGPIVGIIYQVLFVTLVVVVVRLLI